MSGVEWVIEAFGCEPESLKDASVLRTLFDEIIQGMKLRPVSAPQWHQFPRTGGITGLCLLAESHLAIHTWPERSFVTVDVYVCNLATDNSDKAQRLFSALEAVLKPARTKYQVIHRGSVDG